MIKLIATDMDGTLLDANGNVPKNFFSTLNLLNEKNIKFVVASGRPYATLYKNFQPISDSLDYICDNGAFVVMDGKTQMSVMDPIMISNIINNVEEIDNAEVILCGTKGSYHKKIKSEFQEEIDKYYIQDHIVEDLHNIDDDIFKVTICDLSNPKYNSYDKINSKFGQSLMVVISGQVWIDITNKNVNKGIALKSIQDNEKISKNETMVFGDFYNDIPMLQRAHFSFVMENANEDMKQHGNYIAKKNTEEGVISAIKEYVLDN